MVVSIDGSRSSDIFPRCMAALLAACVSVGCDVNPVNSGASEGEDETTLAERVPDGEVAVRLSSGTDVVGGVIETGDRVDLIGRFALDSSATPVVGTAGSDIDQT